MIKQMSFSASEWAGKKQVTRRVKFLAQMEAAVPWARLARLIEKHYPAGNKSAFP